MTCRNVLFSALAATAALWLPSGAALGGTFSISPLRIELSGNATTAALTVRNEEDAPVVVQADASVWEQSGGEDELTPTRDLLVSPAVFTLPANGSQLVRVALRRAPDSQRELSYRLTLQEVPQPASPDFNGLKIALRLSLPVFVAPPAAVAPQLAWSAHLNEQGQVVVTATNSGGAHARILHFSIVATDGSAGAFEQPAAANVLAGQSRSWTLDHDHNDTSPKGPRLADAAVLRLKGLTDQGEFATELVVQR